MAVFAHQAVDVAHVVGMIVGQHDSFHCVHLYAVAAKFVDHFCYVNPGVDKHPGGVIADECAVARTPAAERYEFQPIDYRYIF